MTPISTPVHASDSLADVLDTTRIHRVAGRTGARTAFVMTRPFRAPHHTISVAGLIGDGLKPCYRADVQTEPACAVLHSLLIP
jgi:predicted ATPase with chaperone activity